MTAGQTANRDDLDAGIGKHLVEIRIHPDRAAVLGAKLLGIKSAGRIDRGDLSEAGRIDGGDMCGGDPAMSDDADVIFFHSAFPVRRS